MSVILALLGIVLAATGVAAIGFGIPINEFTLGTTLVLAGTTGLAGGLILIGLAAVVAELGRITEALKTRVVAKPAARLPETAVGAEGPSIVAAPVPAIAAGGRPSQANVPSEANVPSRLRHESAGARASSDRGSPAAPTPSAVDVSSTAIERLRSSIPRTERTKAEPSLVADQDDVPLSPNGAGHQQAQPLPPSAIQSESPEAKIAADDRAGGAAVDVLKASRLDFLFRSKPARPTTSPRELRYLLARRTRGREKCRARGWADA